MKEGRRTRAFTRDFRFSHCPRYIRWFRGKHHGHLQPPPELLEWQSPVSETTNHWPLSWIDIVVQTRIKVFLFQQAQVCEWTHLELTKLDPSQKANYNLQKIKKIKIKFLKTQMVYRKLTTLYSHLILLTWFKVRLRPFHRCCLYRCEI